MDYDNIEVSIRGFSKPSIVCWSRCHSSNRWYYRKKRTFTNTTSPGYIQDLIDNADPGDTIYIPSGTYYENIIINKSISLIGEDKNTTIIDGGGVGTVIRIRAGSVNVSGFTILNTGEWPSHAGINIEGTPSHGKHKFITGNIIVNNSIGIEIIGWISSTISGNSIYSNRIGIKLNTFGDNTVIQGNKISNNGCGISGYNLIMKGNIISENECGIEGSGIIVENNISNNRYGLNLTRMQYIVNVVRKNNFIDNIIHASFIDHLMNINIWIRNYWNEMLLHPKLIIGKQITFYSHPMEPKYIPWINIDLFPALKPYDI